MRQIQIHTLYLKRGNAVWLNKALELFRAGLFKIAALYSRPDIYTFAMHSIKNKRAQTMATEVKFDVRQANEKTEIGTVRTNPAAPVEQ